MKKVYFWLSILAAVFTVFAGLEPSFAQVSGAPIGLGLVAAGFAIAYGLMQK